VLVELLPEFERAIGFEQESRYHDLTVDEHTFAVVQAAADANASLAVRLATLFHDLGKPHVAWRGPDGRLHYYAKQGFAQKSHEQVGAELATSALSRLRYPNGLRSRAARIVRHHMFQVGNGDALRARRFLAKYGDELAFELLDHKEADFRGKRTVAEAPVADLEKVNRFRQMVRREQKSPHRLADLAVDGTDLIELGFTPGPELGQALQALLHDVVEDPSRNTPEELRRRAAKVLTSSRR
jgi:tRNA nucleotidyltransferase (CCA-adding enzyme)